MRALSLFSGVGGFELGMGRAGVETVAQVENDPWCLSVLERHWPEVERIDDVRKVDATTFQGRRRNLERDGAGATLNGFEMRERPGETTPPCWSPSQRCFRRASTG